MRTYYPQGGNNDIAENTNFPPQSSDETDNPITTANETFDNEFEGTGTITFDNAFDCTGNITVEEPSP